MRNKIKIHRRTNRSVGPWKRDSQSVRTKRNYISKKFLAYRGPFFLLFSPSKDQREARKGESTRSTRTLRNLFVYHALGGIQVRRRVSYSLASRRNISLSSFEASILPSWLRDDHEGADGKRATRLEMNPVVAGKRITTVMLVNNDHRSLSRNTRIIYAPHIYKFKTA